MQRLGSSTVAVLSGSPLPIVGRAEEVRQLTGAVVRAAGGQGRVYFLTGQAGIGKTRLAHEALAIARQQGFQLLEGHAYPLERNLAYGLILDTFGPFLRGLDPVRRSALVTGLLRALALLFLNAHDYGFAIGIAFFTLQVFVLGYLIFKSGFIPNVLGVLFIVAAVGYLIDSFGQLLLPHYGATPAFIALPIVIAEIAFPLWLLIKGVNAAQWEQRGLASA